MALHKLRKLDESTAGLTVPIDDLRELGLADMDGNLLFEEQYARVRMTDDGEWEITLVDMDATTSQSAELPAD
ncbi:hypothetical protein [Halorussus marinus]|uniref:hypothetical protein n=1 Tax=Halorussus marinus TaxID=2505976 RepID=UPI0010923EC5|nr:hypothetical protein [Halorussus marinus]